MDSTLAHLPQPPAGKTGWPWTQESSTQSTPAAMANEWPRISIVTPSYNQGDYIEATIRSVLLQNYPNLEYFIMDGGSDDQTVDIIRRYEPWVTQWVSEPDRGQSHAINKGLDQGTGVIFAWLNSDDMLLPDALWRVAEAYQKYPQAAAWAGTCHLIRPNGRIIKSEVPRGLTREGLADWFYGGFFFQPSCFFSARAWQAIHGVDESLNFAMDVDLAIRLAEQGEYVKLPDALSAAIIHDEAKTQALRPEMHAEIMYVQIKYGYDKLAFKRLRELLEATAEQERRRSRLSVRLKRMVRRVIPKQGRDVQYVQTLTPNQLSNQANG
ncbi:MAG: glycosyltransferase [Ardenticatenaceae bacterium]|nr:glycosyltransferase [Ardenticatenaceae bacterium]